MRYHALALDYDGTLAHNGKVAPEYVEALKKVKASGRKLLLVTGRILNDLKEVFPEHELFDRIVAENGGLMYTPETKEEKILGEVPPPEFYECLLKAGVDNLSQGRCIVATWEPHETTVLDTIKNMGLALNIIFNKGAVMVLPSGINKASGLMAALDDLKLSPHSVVSCGDAENDHAFLAASECAIATENAIDTLKERADYVTKKDHGEGVCEIIDMLVESDLIQLEPKLKRHNLIIGQTPDGKDVEIVPYSTSILVCGPSGSGKSTTVKSLLERFVESKYQYSLIDPEGDYEQQSNALVLGNPERATPIDEFMHALESPANNVVVNLLGVPLADRPTYCSQVLPAIRKLRSTYGRPHWTVIDEVHHLMPTEWERNSELGKALLHGLVLVTVHPDQVAPSVIREMDVVIVIGEDPHKTFENVCKATGDKMPKIRNYDKDLANSLIWYRSEDEAPIACKIIPPTEEHHRHIRKYAEGDLGDDRSFYFKGPDGKLNLKAQNLVIFSQLAEGVDDDTWTYHLRRNEYSKWFGTYVKDDTLAEIAREVEDAKGLDPKESRKRIQKAIEERYSAPV
ncbi:MAG: HAD hydrolase family protein [Candidatus Melainabacteria bacterium]|nr:HAD hydrolase family protein [Candidatus Melainabacteria bacterium]